MINSIKNKIEIKDVDELENLQSNVKQVTLVEKLGKQGFHYDVKELFEPITNSIEDDSKNVTKIMM